MLGESQREWFVLFDPVASVVLVVACAVGIYFLYRGHPVSPDWDALFDMSAEPPRRKVLIWAYALTWGRYRRDLPLRNRLLAYGLLAVIVFLVVQAMAAE